MTTVLKRSRLQKEGGMSEVVAIAKGVGATIATNASFVWTSQEMEEQTPRDRNVWSKNAQDPLLTKIKTHDELLGGN